MPSGRIRTAAALLLTATAAFCQAFDVATVRPSQAAKGDSGLGATPGTLTIRNLPLRLIIGAAYGLAEFQISGPEWMRQDRFDIVAKTNTTVANQDAMFPLLQPLLAERFRLATHRETRELPAFVLRIARNGPKLESTDSDSAEMNFKKANKSAGTRIRASHLTMAQFAEMLSHRLGKPVRDLTGLTGAYRVNLEWSPEKDKKPTRREKPGKAGRNPSDDLPSIFTALQDQMGLRLEARKAPVEILVVDHIEKTPIAN
jgi:uncharacterized protein (TIGR03435 family)